MTPNIQKRVSELLGLCLKAGQLETGQESSVELIRSKQASIVFLDEDASENTKKRIRNACSFHEVPVYEMESGLIGHSIGKPNRLIAVMKKGGFADKLLVLFQNDKRPEAAQTDNAGVCSLP